MGFRVSSGGDWVEPTTQAAYDAYNGNWPVIILPPGSTETILFKLNWSEGTSGYVEAESSGLPQLSSVLHRELAITTGGLNDLVFTGTEGNTTECIAVDEDNNGIVGYRLYPKPGHTWDDIPPGYLGVRLEVTDCNAVGTATAIIMESYVIVAMAEAYVDASVPEGGDGSFEHPFRHLEEALHAVWDGTVYLFPGTYTLPTIGREGDNLGRLGRLTTLQSVPGEERAVIRGAPEVSGHGLRFVDLILENFRV
ncbi:hypothetical protein IH601_00720, partial [Candidatus Bipolaricaulota bacterium]|nr:hypothetical protein [Candidatus Bipolaricaulota bacterium]